MSQYPEAWLCRELGMAVVKISLITDYDAGVHEGTEAVDATSVLEVFEQNATRIQAVVLDLIGRFPADLDGLGARGALGPTRGDGHARRRPTSASSRRVSRAWPPTACRSASRFGRSGRSPAGGWRAQDASTRPATTGSGPGTISWVAGIRQSRSLKVGRRLDGGRRDVPHPCRDIRGERMNRHPAVLARMASRSRSPAAAPESNTVMEPVHGRAPSLNRPRGPPLATIWSASPSWQGPPGAGS